VTLLAQIFVIFGTLWAYLVGFGASRLEVQKSFDFAAQKVIQPAAACGSLRCGSLRRLAAAYGGLRRPAAT